MGYSVELHDINDPKDTFRVEVTMEGPGNGLAIHPSMTGTSAGNFPPIYLEMVDGKLKLYVWADINEEEPTHKIELNGAFECARTRELPREEETE